VRFGLRSAIVCLVRPHLSCPARGLVRCPAPRNSIAKQHVLRVRHEPTSAPTGATCAKREQVHAKYSRSRGGWTVVWSNQHIIKPSTLYVRYKRCNPRRASMYFWSIIAQLLPKCFDDQARSVVGMTSAGGLEQGDIALPQPEIVPDPLTEANVKSRQFRFGEPGDFCLLALRHESVEQAHRLLDRGGPYWIAGQQDALSYRCLKQNLILVEATAAAAPAALNRWSA
jgi:hypothetical protein